MGSIGKAIKTGFVCRLCTKQRKVVIHFYTSKAKKLDLMTKLKLLPITLKKYDGLPKTVCESCVKKLELQYDLVLRIRKNEGMLKLHDTYHGNGNCPQDCPLHIVSQIAREVVS
ncbi:unnamed protein product [Ceutorhynchus assimilis]|uniref:ZAD domain-containing protein n=1 Tax=Ceutorhynchus assimilis TaxID=467358 RepID=A0A9N9MK39_9CUCU|nr:unnamed protein product [Ceutorhynchus assimilis]